MMNMIDDPEYADALKEMKFEPYSLQKQYSDNEEATRALIM